MSTEADLSDLQKLAIHRLRDLLREISFPCLEYQRLHVDKQIPTQQFANDEQEKWSAAQSKLREAQEWAAAIQDELT